MEGGIRPNEQRTLGNPNPRGVFQLEYFSAFYISADLFGL